MFHSLKACPPCLDSLCRAGTGLGPYYWPDRFLVVLREMQEREKALRLQKERLQRELEEKKKKVGCWENGLHVGSVLSGEHREAGTMLFRQP